LVNGADKTRVVLTWGEISSAPLNGYSDIIGYKVYSNGGSGDTFVILANSTLYGVTTTEISSLTPGIMYSLKVLAYNVHGDGDLSSSLSIISASVPS